LERILSEPQSSQHVGVAEELHPNVHFLFSILLSNINIDQGDLNKPHKETVKYKEAMKRFSCIVDFSCERNGLLRCQRRPVQHHHSAVLLCFEDHFVGCRIIVIGSMFFSWKRMNKSRLT
jgi:hypothetical protein